MFPSAARGWQELAPDQRQLQVTITLHAEAAHSKHKAHLHSALFWAGLGNAPLCALKTLADGALPPPPLPNAPCLIYRAIDGHVSEPKPDMLP